MLTEGGLADPFDLIDATFWFLILPLSSELNGGHVMLGRITHGAVAHDTASFEVALEDRAIVVLLLALAIRVTFVELTRVGSALPDCLQVTETLSYASYKVTFVDLF